MDTSTQKPPDGGWGWMVVLGSFLSHAVTDGLWYSFGILLREMREYFDESRQKMGMVASFADTFSYGIVLPFAGLLLDKCGFRPVGVAGGILFGCGFALSSLAPSMSFLFLSHCMVAGAGLGFSYMPSIVSVTHYFDKRRSFATGIAVSGAGAGTFCFAPLLGYLLDQYGWRGTSLIAGGIGFNCILFASLYRPLRIRESGGNKPQSPSSAKESTVDRCKEETESETPVSADVFLEETDLDNIDKKSRNPCLSLPRRAAAAVFSYLSVLKNRTVLLWGCGSILHTFGTSIPYTFLPDMAVLAGNTREQAVLLISIAGLANTLSRLILGWLSDRQCVNRPLMYAIDLSLIGLIVALMPVCARNYILLACNVTLYGTLYGYRVAQSSVVMAELFGVENVARAMGTLSLFGTASALAAAPLAGMMYDKTETYTIPFGVMGTLTILGSLLHYAMLCTPEYKQSRQRLKEREDNPEV